MTKVDGRLRSLLQGVSQQPPRDRLPGQSTTQNNMSSEPVKGLVRRPPTDLVGSLGVATVAKGWHNFKTSDGNKYIAMAANGSLTISDYNGVQKLISIIDNAGVYLNLGGTLKFVTVENETVISNTAASPVMLPAVKKYVNQGAGSNPMGIIQVLGGQYGRIFSIAMDGNIIASYKPPNGGTATDVDKIRTKRIATQLVTCMTSTVVGTTNPDGASSEMIISGALSDASQWTVTQYEDTITILRKGATADKIPIMTANPTAGVTLSASSIGTGSVKAVGDKDASTYFQTATSGINWIKADLGAAVVLTQFVITAPANGLYTNTPTNFSLRGSNDNVNWTTLRTVVGQSWNKSDVNKWSLSGAAYRYYQLINASTGAMCVAEWNLNIGATPPVFELVASDDTGNVNLKADTSKVSGTEDLARVAPHGYCMRVATETDPDEDLFFEFLIDDWDATTVIGSNFGHSGYWQECVAPDVPYMIDHTTMPHVLEYIDTTQTFLLRQGKWEDRRVGTLVSNPNPSFIGGKINAVSEFQSRLVLLSGPNVVMSRTNKSYDFWQASASALVDTDPIDISSTAVEASVMLSATPHNRDLVVFSPNGQFVVFGRTALTPANATLVLTTAYEAQLIATPAPSGRNVFFATDFGRFTGIREFYTEGSTDINDTRPVTQHVKTYLEGSATKLTSSATYETLLVQTDASLRDVYVYQFIWSDKEKVQSCWSTWTYPYPVVYSFFDEADFYHVVQSPNNEMFLLRSSLEVRDSTGLTFPICLDARFDVFSCHTAFQIPYDSMFNASLMVVQGPNCPNPGLEAQIKSIDLVSGHYVVTLKDDMLGGDVVGGIVYDGVYVPTSPYIRDASGSVVGTANLVVSDWIISLRETGGIRTRVLSKYGNSDYVDFEGRILGAPDDLIGQVALSDDQIYMPFGENTDDGELEITATGFLPLNLLDMEWIGSYTKKGRRISDGGGG